MKYISLIVCLFFSHQLFSQSFSDDNNKIKVSGMAEIDIEPTSYILEICIKEFTVSNRDFNDNSGFLYPIDSIEHNLYKQMANLKLDSKRLVPIYISKSTEGSNYRVIQLIRENYNLNVESYDEMYRIVKNFDFKGLLGIRIKKQFNIDKSGILSKLYSSALDDAKSRAKGALSNVKKTVGEIVFIDMFNNFNFSIFEETNQTDWNGANYTLDLSRKKHILVTLNATFRIIDL